MQIDTRGEVWTGGFVAGLVCGEGNFTIAISRSPTCRLGIHARPIFQIEMSRIDEQLLVGVRDFMGFGYINYPKPRTRAYREAPTCKYLVTDLAGCGQLVAFFRENPLVGAKQMAFEKWASCLEIIADGRHTSDAGMRMILDIREGMNQHRRPSSFGGKDRHGAQLPAATGRNLRPWSDSELGLIEQYNAGAMSRSDLIVRLGRSKASVANQISRMRRR